MQGWSSRFFAPNKGIDLLNPFVGYWAGSGDYGETATNIQTLVDISGNGRNASQAEVARRPQFTPGDIPYFTFNNNQVKMPLPIMPADMNGRPWSVYFRLAPLSVSGMIPIMSGGADVANQTFLILFYNANPSISQHSQSPAYLTSSYVTQVGKPLDMLIVHTVKGAEGVNDLYADDKKDSITWNTNLSVGNTYPILLGNYYRYNYTSQFKLNRFAFWRDRAITAAEFAQLRAAE